MKKVKILYLMPIISILETSGSNKLNVSDEAKYTTATEPVHIQNNNPIQMQIWQIPNPKKSINITNINITLSNAIREIQNSKHLSNETKRNMNTWISILPILHYESKCIDENNIMILTSMLPQIDDANVANRIAQTFCKNTSSKPSYAKSNRNADSRKHWQYIIGDMITQMYESNTAVTQYVDTIIKHVRNNDPLKTIEPMYALMLQISRTNNPSVPADALSIMPHKNPTLFNRIDKYETLQQFNKASNLINLHAFQKNDVESEKLSIIMDYISHSAKLKREELNKYKLLIGLGVLGCVGLAIATLIGLSSFWSIANRDSENHVYHRHHHFYRYRQGTGGNVVQMGVQTLALIRAALYSMTCFFTYGFDNVQACGLPGHFLNNTLCDPYAFWMSNSSNNTNLTSWMNLDINNNTCLFGPPTSGSWPYW